MKYYYLFFFLSLGVSDICAQSDIIEIEKLLELSSNAVHTNQDSAIIYANDVIKYAKSIDDNKYISKGYNKLGNAYLLASEQDMARKVYQKAIDYAKKIDNKKIIAKNEKSIGKTFESEGQYKLAIKQYNIAEQYALEIKDTSLLADCALDIGVIYAKKGEYYVAAEYFFKSIEYYEAIDETSNSIALLNNIASIYLEVDEYDKALIALKKAKNELRNTENEDIKQRHSIYLFLNLGRTYYSLDSNDIAIENYNLALDEVEKTDNNNLKSITYNQLGAIYFRLNEIDTSLKYYQASYELLKDENYLDDFTIALRGLARIYQKKGNYTKAFKLIQESIEINISIDDLDDLMLDYKLLSSIYINLGNTKEGYFYLKKHIELADSVFDIKKSAQVALLESEYNYKHEELDKEHELENLKVKQFAQIKEVKQVKILLWGLLIFIFLITLGTIRFYRISKTKTLLSEQLKNKTAELESLNKTKTRFFTNVSHELKTPLTLIINPIEKMLTQKGIDNESYFLLKTVKKHSYQLLDLTNQVLELTKFDTSQVALNTSNVNLHELMQLIYSEFESLAVSRKIKFTFENKLNSTLVVSMDTYKLETIVKNLISNAIKFTLKNGNVVLKSSENEETIEIIVTDTGRGIQKNEISKVFDRYYQASSPNLVSEGGTGIGLAICKEYVKALGGTISVTSVWKEGTTFKVVLPKNKVESNNLQKLDKPLHLHKEEVLKQKEINNLPLVLLVEDNLSMQNYLEYILRQNFNVHIANNGQEALDYLKKHRPQLIISDVIMPIMNGHQFLENCKTNVKTASIPFIMLTAVSATSEKIKLLRLGIDDYILKPFIDEELMVRIDNLLNNATNRENYQAEILKTTNEPVVFLTTENQRWLETVEIIVKEKCHRFDFSVDFLAFEVALSRSQTHRKIKTLTGLTPKEYITNIRFDIARELLKNKPSITIKAIALSVGFKDEKYFSRKFKKHFGKNPSEYLN